MGPSARAGVHVHRRHRRGEEASSHGEGSGGGGEGPGTGTGATANRGESARRRGGACEPLTRNRAARRTHTGVGEPTGLPTPIAFGTLTARDESNRAPL